MSEYILAIVGGVIGIAWGCSYIVVYHLGRIHQMDEDHRRELARIRRPM